MTATKTSKKIILSYFMIIFQWLKWYIYTIWTILSSAINAKNCQKYPKLPNIKVESNEPWIGLTNTKKIVILTKSSTISLMADTRRMNIRGTKVVYLPVGDTSGIC